MLGRRNSQLVDNFFKEILEGPIINHHILERAGDVIKKRPINVNSVSTNVIETKGDYRYEMATPGFISEDIKVSLDHNNLTVEGEKKVADKQSDKDYLSKEFHFYKFSRSFDVPENIVLDEIHAKVENGITTLFLPKETLGKVKKVKRSIEVG